MEPKTGKRIVSKGEFVQVGKKTTGRFHWEIGVVAALGLHAYLVWQAGFTGLSYSLFTQLALTFLVPAAIISLLVAGVKEQAQGANKRFQHLLLAVLIGVTSCYVSSPLLLFLGDCGARKRIAEISEETRLQIWAEELLQRPLAQIPVTYHFGAIYILGPHALPTFVRGIPASRGGAEYCLVAEEHGASYITIAIWQGRPHSWGVLLCRRNHPPLSLPNKWLHRWRAGVYGWQDQNENS